MLTVAVDMPSHEHQYIDQFEHMACLFSFSWYNVLLLLVLVTSVYGFVGLETILSCGWLLTTRYFKTTEHLHSCYSFKKSSVALTRLPKHPMTIL